MTRKRTTPGVVTTCRLPAETHERLRVAAEERDVSMTYLLIKAVEQFLDRLIPVDEMAWTRDSRPEGKAP